jgi:hypothetical protein
MESKSSVSGAGGKKQKSLMAFFAKQARPATVRPKSPPQTTSTHRPSDLKGSPIPPSPRSASSSVAGSGKDTPPTSDIHNVEMEVDREEVSFTVRIRFFVGVDTLSIIKTEQHRQTRYKRKVVTSDSDSEMAIVSSTRTDRRRTQQPSSSPSAKSKVSRFPGGFFFQRTRRKSKEIARFGSSPL